MSARARKLFIVRNDLTNDAEFTQDINIPFEVDELHIKQIAYNPAVNGADAFSLSWQGIGELCVLIDADIIIATNTVIDVRGKPIMGSHTFKFSSVAGAPYSVTSAHLLLLIEAVKY
jgi:hypothetical protein